MQPGLSAGAVSRRLGVAVTTLRTWHQRYGLGPTGHEPGSHRRYTEDDLTRLEAMLRLTSQGIPASEAARLVAGSGAARLVAGAGAARLVAGSEAARLVAGSGAAGLAANGAGALIPRPARAGGGEVIPVGKARPVARPAARGIAAAAVRLDAAAVRTRIMAEISRRGVVETWTSVLVPVLIGVGDRQRATSRFIEVEHLLSRCVSEVFAAVPRPDNPPPTRLLLACADEEQHSLPLEAVEAALAERGRACRMLGARVPSHALSSAVGRTGPTMVMLWSHDPVTGDPAQLRALQRHPNRPAIVAAAGPGWHDLPEGVLAPATLEEAVAIALTASA